MLYTAGFLFCRNDTEVLLVQKQKPGWMRGLLNAVGGKVEAGETSDFCISREFQEETGIPVTVWQFLACELGPDYQVDFFHHHWAGDHRPTPPVANDVGELLGWVPVEGLFERPAMPCVGNLRWLIPLALDWRRPCAHVRAVLDVKERPSW